MGTPHEPSRCFVLNSRVRTSSKSAARCRPRHRAGEAPSRDPGAQVLPPGERGKGGNRGRKRVPTQTVAEEIREKGPAHVQSRRRKHRNPPHT